MSITIGILILVLAGLKSIPQNTAMAKEFTEFTKRSRDISDTMYDECFRECVCRNGNLENCHRVRKEFTSMKFSERILFIETLKKLASNSVLKAEYSRIVNIHRDLFYSGLHEKVNFLPWHRWFLLQFENLLRKIDCRVTIPYWDWARVAQTYWRGSHIRDIWNPGPHGLGGNGAKKTSCVHDGPFKQGRWFVKMEAHVRCLKRQFNKDVFPKDSGYVLRAVNASFDQFERQMRNTFHADIHCLIGGTMCTNASSSAPEFWLHHSFLDKLWADFQSRSPAHKYAFFPTLSAAMPGCHERPRDVLDSRNLPGGVRVIYCPPLLYDQPLEPDEDLNAN